MTEIDAKEIRELFSQAGIVVGDVDINQDENIANVYIEVGIEETYTIYGVESILKKIKDVRTVLTEGGLIEDITLGDLYKGSWRILVHFKQDE